MWDSHSLKPSRKNQKDVASLRPSDDCVHHGQELRYRKVLLLHFLHAMHMHGMCYWFIFVSYIPYIDASVTTVCSLQKPLRLHQDEPDGSRTQLDSCKNRFVQCQNLEPMTRRCCCPDMTCWKRTTYHGDWMTRLYDVNNIIIIGDVDCIIYPSKNIRKAEKFASRYAAKTPSVGRWETLRRLTSLLALCSPEY